MERGACRCRFRSGSSRSDQARPGVIPLAAHREASESVAGLGDGDGDGLAQYGDAIHVEDLVDLYGRDLEGAVEVLLELSMAVAMIVGLVNRGTTVQPSTCGSAFEVTSRGDVNVASSSIS